VASIIELFTELRSQGTTLLLAEERAKGILDVADHVILMELGRILWSGPGPIFRKTSWPQFTSARLSRRSRPRPRWPPPARTGHGSRGQ
jgi:energy-coupling factor transporter ATP-binding protein EcfA2